MNYKAGHGSILKSKSKYDFIFTSKTYNCLRQEVRFYGENMQGTKPSLTVACGIRLGLGALSLAQMSLRFGEEWRTLL